MDELEQIQQQISDLQRKAAAISTARKTEVLKEIHAKIKAFGLTARDLGFSDRSESVRNPVAVKYRMGDLTWSGRGRKPKFIEDHLASGGKLDDLSV